MSELRGIRAPGTGLPGVDLAVHAAGKGFRQFAAVNGLTGRATVVETRGAEFDRLVTSREGAAKTAETIRRLLT